MLHAQTVWPYFIRHKCTASVKLLKKVPHVRVLSTIPLQYTRDTYFPEMNMPVGRRRVSELELELATKSRKLFIHYLAVWLLIHGPYKDVRAVNWISSGQGQYKTLYFLPLTSPYCKYKYISAFTIRRKDASWSLNWPSGANLLAHKPHNYFLCVPLWLLCTCFSLLLGEN